MSAVTSYIIPLILLAAGLACFRKNTDVFACLSGGVEEGLRTVLRMAATLIPLLTAVSMLRASGALGLLSDALAPVTDFLGIPREVTPLIAIRPLSGGGTLAAGTDVMRSAGVDSDAGRVAAIVMASTETTLYTAALYFSAAGVKKSGWVLPAAFSADFAAFILASLSIRLFF